MSPNVDAVAIRFDPLESFGIKDPSIQKLRPVALLARQGMQLAGTSAASEAISPQQIGRSAPLPSLSSPDERLKVPGQSPLQHALNRVIFILDRSDSMAEPLLPQRNAESKIDHLRCRIDALPPDYFDPTTKISLITFGDDALELRNQQGETLAAFKDLLRSPDCAPKGATAFTPAFKLAQKILRHDFAAQGEGLRSLVVFLTDGHDNGQQSAAAREIRELRKLNAAVFVGGIGEYYSLSRIVELAGFASYAGWGHSPMESGASQQSLADFDLFCGYIPRITSDMQANDAYLSFGLAGDFINLTSATYSLFPAPLSSRSIRGGYASTVRGVLLEGKSENLKISLNIEPNAQSDDPAVREVPLIDARDAASRFEDREEAQALINQWLLGIVVKGGDMNQIKALATALPEGHPVREFVNAHSKPQHFSAEDNHHSFMSRSITGTLLGTRPPPRGERANNWSFIPDVSPQQESPAMHSGGLGALQMPPASDIPPLVKPNPAAYDHAPGKDFPSLHVLHMDGSIERAVPLESLLLSGDPFSIGRDPSVSLRIPVPNISRKHCEIRLKGDALALVDTGSRNGTFLNRTRIPSMEEILLKDGDVISLCQVEIKLKIPQHPA